jgi:hypothetical protein
MKKMLALAFALACGTAAASTGGGFNVAILVGDVERTEYAARGNVYVEAIRGENYAIRLSNPTPYRVAVALSVDGLNTIDASHLRAASAPKWVLEPYESTVISGWQVSDRTARRFFFTGEKNSYGAALGQVENLGVIEAVFYRERQRRIDVYAPRPESRDRNSDSSKRQAPSAGAIAPSDEYAGTGMGGRTRHEVERVHFDLEESPAATVRIRYEFRQQLIKLGVLPQFESPLDRRERARGFENYCPEPR